MKPAVAQEPTIERYSSTKQISSLTVVIAGAISFAVAMGIGRFAFTPILPMMIHDGILTLVFGGTLAAANYLGYLAGAMLCMGLPRTWSSAALVRWSAAATVALSLGMTIDNPHLWIVLRFFAGIASAISFVYTIRWCLTILSSRGKGALGSIMFIGVGLGIAFSGFVVMGMVHLQMHSKEAWLGFSVISALALASIWRTFAHDHAAPVHHSPAGHAHSRKDPKGNFGEMPLFALAYGLAGFGYIVTATFLPVIARAVLPASASVWMDFFWPIFGISAAFGVLLVVRTHFIKDARVALILCYLIQGIGIAGVIFMPTVAGFILGSILAGLPFNAINFFAMQEVRRLKPHHEARYMGLLTALFGIGQIAGPPMVNAVLTLLGDQKAGFSMSLKIASGSLCLGAIIYLAMSWLWPRVGPSHRK